MNLRKPKFWDYRKPNLISFLLWPISLVIQILALLKHKSNNRINNIKTICIGNIYVGGTGKTSLAIRINEILSKEKFKTCFIKKYYKNQIDEQRLLKNHGKLFCKKKRIEALDQAVKEKYDIAIFDDGLQDYSINYDLKIICFNNKNWIGNGMTIPSGPLRENIKILRKFDQLFLNGNNENLYEIEKKILSLNPKINIHKGKYTPVNLDKFELNSKYIAFSGIGNHQTFIEMIRKYGFNVIKDFEFPDHYSYSAEDIEKMLNSSKKLGCKIVTTEKDYQRLHAKMKTEIQFIKTTLVFENEKELVNAILN
tara:strand:+ start:3132 stop:4061 length:930 start_codon:yes stop_codon:yes gene_type:complete